jgi:endonuclease/exonuclease/phosphatase family metal-dependent hydrolase
VGDVVRIVNLNAAMGYENSPGDPGGTDATDADLDLLANDILGQDGDIANLQEMALPAATRLRTILDEKTGDTWELNWAKSVQATYYAGKDRAEGPSPGYENVPAGNAQLIRIGDGIVDQEPITLDDQNDDQGIVLPSGQRSFQGAQVTTEHGGVVDVYNTHLGLADQVPDDQRAADVRRIQETTESRTNPVVLTGDFNQEVDVEPGRPHESPRTVAAIRAFMDEYGYTDVARDKGPTSNQKRESRGQKRIDYILTRDVPTTRTVRFASKESDHWGLATTIEPDGGPSHVHPTTTEPGGSSHVHPTTEPGGGSSHVHPTTAGAASSSAGGS